MAKAFRLHFEEVDATAVIHSMNFSQLTYYYDEKNKIIENCDFEFPVGKNVWIEGCGGRGKSTVLKILAGLQMPQTGRYQINHQWVGDMTFEEFLPIRLKIGYSFDLGGLLNNRTLRENILLPVRYHKADRFSIYEEWFYELVQLFELERGMDLRPAEASGAERKLACIIRAFILLPEMLLLDDPETGLSAVSSRKLAGLIERGRQEGWLRHVFVTASNQAENACLSPIKKIMEKELTVAPSNRKVVLL